MPVGNARECQSSATFRTRPLPTMGLPPAAAGRGFDRVLSSEKHYSAFQCGVCTELVSLDAVVTDCSHPYCRPCLETWEEECSSRQEACTCPLCKNVLGKVDVPITARPLQEAQLLAYRVLSLIQVSCDTCDWVGDYGELKEHRQTLHKEAEATNLTAATATAKKIVLKDESTSASDNPASEEHDQETPPYSPSRNVAIRANETPEKQPLATATSSSTNGDVHKSNDSDDGEGTADGPSSTATESRPAQANRPHLKRTALNTSINSMAFCNPENGDAAVEEEAETTANVTDDEDGESADQAEPATATEEGSPQDTKLLLERTDKLKKQANARFNKGDFAVARSLYTEGLEIMTNCTVEKESERKLLAHMHSNRGVTYFREKEFKACIADCKKAVEYDPTYDKSWVRLWRAHVAEGEFDIAHAVLEKAVQTVPNSQRVNDELQRSIFDRLILDRCDGLIKRGNFLQAKNALGHAPMVSTNIKLLCVAAQVDIKLGDVMSAVDISAKALRLNPKNAEALEIQGWVKFLMGETEQGAHMIYDAYRLDDTSETIKSRLTKSQNTHASLSQAQSLMKKGKHEESLTHFTAAIDESEPVSQQSPLFAVLKAKRADAFLRSGKYLEALKDCSEVFTIDKNHSTAWVIRAEVLVALGKGKDAIRELSKIRRSWGSDDNVIEDGFKRIDFEMRVTKEEEHLAKLMAELETGTCSRVAKFGGSSGRGTTPAKRRDSTSSFNTPRRGESSRRLTRKKSSGSNGGTSRRRNRRDDDDSSVGVNKSKSSRRPDDGASRRSAARTKKDRQSTRTRKLDASSMGGERRSRKFKNPTGEKAQRRKSMTKAPSERLRKSGDRGGVDRTKSSDRGGVGRTKSSSNPSQRSSRR